MVNPGMLVAMRFRRCIGGRIHVLTVGEGIEWAVKSVDQ